MFKSRFFQILVCVALICCMIFNYATIPAKATAVGSIALGTVSGAAAAGIAGTLFAVAMGVVCVGLTAQLIIDIGKNLRQSGIDFYQNDTEKQTQWTTWIDGLVYDLGGGGDGTGSSGGDPYNDPFLNLAGNTLVYDVLQNWGAKLMNGEGIETEGEAAAEGYAYYNGHYLKRFTEYATLPARTILMDRSGTYYLFENDVESFYKSSGSDGTSPSISFGYSYRSVYTGDSWAGSGRGVYNNISLSDYTVIWSSVPIYNSDNTLYFPASQPIIYEQTVVQPSIYVGDIPQKIQNGEADEDDIVIPDIDYSKIFEGQTDAVTALDRVSTQLADGTMTYDQYLEMTTPQIGTGDNTNTGTGTDVWNPPENPGQFALDLSNYFPFCIPFDLYDFFSCLNADPVAPVIHWEIALPGGSTYPIELDLSPFDSVAQLLRRLQLLLFIVGLAIKTRDIIKG